MFKFKSICLFTVLSVAVGSTAAGPKGGGKYIVHQEISHSSTGVHSYGRNAGGDHVASNVKSTQPSNRAKSYVDNGRGSYAGIGLGNSELVIDGVKETFEDTNFRAYLGYDLNRYFAIEGGVNSVPLEEYLNDVGDLTGIDVSVLAKLPITSRLSGYARLGYWDWDFSDSSTSKNHSFFGGTDMLYGIGLDYQISSRFKVRLDATRYEADDAELDTLLGSVAYSW